MRVKGGPDEIEVDEEELARTIFVALSDDDIKAVCIRDLLHTMKKGGTKARIIDQEITALLVYVTSGLSNPD